MHPLLVNFSIFTWMSILSSEEKVLTFLTDLGLIPSCDLVVTCVKYGTPMSAWSNSSRKVRFRFVCSNRKNTKCSGSVDPLSNTFFEKTRIPFCDILAIVFCFVLKLPASFCLNQFCSWRKTRNERPMHAGTITDYFSYCREVCEVIASHDYKQLGGLGKTISVDETFLTVRKYNRGRVCESSTVVVFGMYCREDREGLFFEVEGKKKRDIWPYIKHFCHPETSVICSDEAKQYHGVKKLFKGAVHKTTNHSKGEFVSKTDKSNTINDLENENKQLKRDLKRRRPKDTLFQFMGVYFYRRTRLSKLETDGERVFQFLCDIKSVYSGPGKEGLKMKKMEEISVESEGIGHLLKDYRTRGGGGELEDLDLGDSEYEVEDIDDPNWDSM